MARHAGVIAFPVDLPGLPEAKPADAAADRDVGERVAVAVAPVAAFEVFRHERHAAVDARDLLVGPYLAALALFAQRFIAHEQARVEHAVGERLPAAHGDAIARLV